MALDPLKSIKDGIQITVHIHPQVKVPPSLTVSDIDVFSE